MSIAPNENFYMKRRLMEDHAYNHQIKIEAIAIDSSESESGDDDADETSQIEAVSGGNVVVETDTSAIQDMTKALPSPAESIESEQEEMDETEVIVTKKPAVQNPTNNGIQCESSDESTPNEELEDTEACSSYQISVHTETSNVTQNESRDDDQSQPLTEEVEISQVGAVSGENEEVETVVSEIQDMAKALQSPVENIGSEEEEMDETEVIVANKTAVQNPTNKGIQYESGDESTPNEEHEDTEACSSYQISVHTQIGNATQNENRDDQSEPPNEEVEGAEAAVDNENGIECPLIDNENQHESHEKTVENGEDNAGNPNPADSRINRRHSESNHDATPREKVLEDVRAAMSHESIANPPPNIGLINRNGGNTRKAKSGRRKKAPSRRKNVPSRRRKVPSRRRKVPSRRRKVPSRPKPLSADKILTRGTGQRNGFRSRLKTNSVTASSKQNAGDAGTSKGAKKSRVRHTPNKNTFSKARKTVIPSPVAESQKGKMKERRKELLMQIGAKKRELHQKGLKALKKYRRNPTANSKVVSIGMSFSFDQRDVLLSNDAMEVPEAVHVYPELKLYDQMQEEFGRIKGIVEVDKFEEKLIAKMMKKYLNRPCDHEEKSQFCLSTREDSSSDHDRMVASVLYTHLCKVTRKNPSTNDLEFQILEFPQTSTNEDESDSSEPNQLKERRPQPVIVVNSVHASLFDDDGFNVVCEKETFLEDVSLRKAIFAVYYLYEIFHMEYNGNDSLIFKDFKPEV